MKKNRSFSAKFFKLGVASLLASTALFGASYNVDASHSNVGFKVKHMMISNVKGQFDQFSGSFEVNDKTGKITALTGAIEVASINTAHEKRDGHLKASDFFAVEKFPQITFKLDSIKEDKAYGEITLRGVTKPVALDFEQSATIKDPWGNTRMGLVLSGKINRMDYGLRYNKVLEAGGVAVGEMVKLDIELEGIQAK